MDRKKINCFSAASIALMTTGFSGAVTAAEYDVDFVLLGRAALVQPSAAAVRCVAPYRNRMSGVR